MLRRVMTTMSRSFFQARGARFAGVSSGPEQPLSHPEGSHNTAPRDQAGEGKHNVNPGAPNKGHSFTENPLGKSEFKNPNAKLADTKPEYQEWKSVEQIQKQQQNPAREDNRARWREEDHLSANDEINHRGIDQRAKEWGIPAEKLEKLKPWEHHPKESHPEAYKDTVMKGKNYYGEGKGKRFFGTMKSTGKSGASQHMSEKDLKSGSQFNESASGTKEWDASKDKFKADQKWEDKVAEHEGMTGACQTDKYTGKCTTHSTARTYHANTVQEADKLKSDRNTTQGQLKDAQNDAQTLDQGMVDKAMSWVKDKFGGSGSSQKEGPTADHNATNKGYDDHTKKVHKATFTTYEDSKKPFSSSVEEGQKKTEKKETKNYLNQNQ